MQSTKEINETAVKIEKNNFVSLEDAFEEISNH